MLKYNYGLKQDKEEKCESADDAKTCKSINIKWVPLIHPLPPLPSTKFMKQFKKKDNNASINEKESIKSIQRFER